VSARATLKARVTLGVTAGLCGFVVAGCGGGRSESMTRPAMGQQLERYLAQVEPIRLAVNRLLTKADPILRALSTHHISALRAADRMGGLERRFAVLAVDIAAIQPVDGTLRSLHATYAETYILEDAYLSALVSGLAQRNLEALPRTQSTQRAAIIRWRTGLAVLARRYGLSLPPDLQQAGRGEIAPSPERS
jgi:hypothetical protein